MLRMINVHIMLVFVMSSNSMINASSSYIPFNDDFIRPQRVQGNSQDKLLKWAVDHQSNWSSGPIVPGINGTSMQLHLTGSQLCNRLIIEPLQSSGPKYWTTNATGFAISFWVYLKIDLSKIQDLSQSLMIVNGGFWPNPEWCWFFYLEILDYQPQNLMASLVNSENDTSAFTFAFPIGSFQMNSWNSIALVIKPKDNIIELYSNGDRSPIKRKFGSKFVCDYEMNRILQFGPLTNSFNNCPTMVLDDVLISELFPHSNVTYKHGWMHYCPQEVINENNHFKCQCWEGYTLKTSNFAGICRDSVTCCVDVDECMRNQHHCPSESQCHNEVGSYNCSSTLTNGICQRQMNGTWTCQCKPGYTGIKCENKSQNFCHSNPCKNGGLCVDAENQFQCICTDGFTGHLCELEKIPDFILALPKAPCFTNNNLTFLAFTYKTVENHQKLTFVWNMGDGITINTSRLMNLSEGLIQFYKTLDIKLTANASIPAYGTLMAYHYRHPAQISGGVSIVNSNHIAQVLPFQLELLQRNIFCKPQLRLTNIFPKDDQIARIDGRKSLLVTSLITFPPQCPEIKTITYEWKTHSKNSTAKFRSNILPDLAYLKIPSSDLPRGTTEISLDAIVHTTENEVLFTRSSGVIEVTSPVVAATIDGGSIRTHPANMDAVVNAWAPFQSKELLANIQYRWFCWTIGERVSEFCRGQTTALQNPKSRLVVPGQYLQKGTVYMLKVEMGEGPTGQYIQELRVTDESSPSVFIRCIENCDVKSSPMINIILQATPSNGRVRWSVEVDGVTIDFDWRRNKCPTRDKTMLCIKPNAFLSGSRYGVRAAIFNPQNQEVGFAVHEIEMTEPIRAGRCVVKPDKGVAIIDKFHVDCQGFGGENLYLLYEIYQRNLFTKQRILVGTSMYVPQFANLTLSPGDKRQRYRSQLLVLARSWELAETRVNIDVTVFPISHRVGSRAIPNFISNLLKDGVIEQLEIQGNIIGAVQLASAVTSTIEIEGTKKPSSRTIARFSRIRQSLVQNLENHLPYDFSTLQQSAAVLEQILNTSLKQLNLNTQRSAMELAENLTTILKTESDNENVDTTHRINGSQSILRAVSDLLIARADAAKPRLNLTTMGPSDYEDRDYFQNADDEFVLPQKIVSKREKSFEISLSSRAFEVLRKLDDVVQGFHNLRLDTTIKGNKIRATVRSNIYKIRTKNQEVYGEIKYEPSTLKRLTKSNLSLGIDKLDFNPLPNQPLSPLINTPFVRVSLRNVSMDNVEMADKKLTVDLFLHRPVNQPLMKVKIKAESMEISIHKLEIPPLIGFAIIRIEPEDEDIYLKAVVTIDHRPSINDFNQSYYVLPKHSQYENSSLDEAYTIVVPVTPESIRNEALYLGVLPVDDLSPRFAYVLSVSFANCYYWDEEISAWSTKGCTVGSQSNSNYLHCNCSHLSLFGGSIFICPNHVHPFLDIHLFLTIRDNPIMVIVLAVVFLTYLILLPIAFAFDRKDRKKEIIILEDNEPERKYLYLIVVSTGFQRSSGTTAHVAVQLRGDLGNSRVYVLGHPTQSILRQGSVDTFLLATETSVGNVNEVLIFHDFHGLQPNWYLRTVIVHDVQLDRQWTISVFRWLTIREAQGNLQFVFKCDQPKTRPKIGFIERASEKFCEEHLLYSIFNKPPLSHFTCVQRLSCFLCVRLLTMLASLMFYGIPRRDKTAQIEVGEFTFSFRQIVIGVESSLVIIPVTFILVLLFSKSKPKRSSYISNIGPQHRMELSFVAQKPRESDPFAFRYHIYSYIDCPRPSVDVPQTFNFRTILSSEYELPHWCAYVAWTLVFLCCAMASYMIILYGLRYGRIGSLNWLVTTITAVLECIFFQEPFLIMVELALIMLLSSLLGQSKGRSLFERIRFPVWRHWNRNYFKFQKQRHYSPLPNQKLQEVEHRNLVRQQTATRVFEIIGFCLFFSSLWTIVIQVKNPIAYQLTHYVKETFINRYHHKEDSHYALQLQQVSNVDQLYEYVEGIVVNGLHDNEWRLDTETNDNPAIDNNIQLLGVARLRQLRVKPDACEAAKILNGSIQHCAPNYYTSINDDGNYLPYWIPWKDAINHSMTSPWIFRRSDYPLSHIIYGHLTTYLDNGYKAELGRNKKNSKLVLKYLSDHNWIDKFTRAVFCEFTLYNTDCNYFTQVTIVFELSAAGAIFPDYHIWTFRPFGYFQQFTPTLVSSIVVFTALFLSYLTWEVVQMIRLKRDYFKDFWNYVDMSILIGCVLMFIFYGIYLDSVRRCVDRIHQTKKNLFVSFYPAVIWDTVSTSTFGLVVCFNMFKVWKLLTFNKRMYTFVMTIREATVAIFNFGIMYMITLMAFIHATYILLGPYDHTFQSIGRNWLHYILFTFGHTAFQPYVNYNPAMGLTIFLLFTLTVYYYLRNMFEAIMMFNFRKVRKDIQKMKNMYEMVKYFRAKLEFMVAYRSSVTRSNETWLEIEQKLTEINNICEVMIERLNR